MIFYTWEQREPLWFLKGPNYFSLLFTPRGWKTKFFFSSRNTLDGQIWPSIIHPFQLFFGIIFFSAWLILAILNSLQNWQFFISYYPNVKFIFFPSKCPTWSPFQQLHQLEFSKTRHFIWNLGMFVRRVSPFYFFLEVWQFWSNVN